jgi:hypothetical protein
MIFRANCTVGRVLRRWSARRKGTVIAQAPAAGTRRAEGGPVNLIVSRRRARRTLSSAGTHAVQATTAMPVLYKNCTNLNKKYPHGLGKAGARDRTSGDPVRNFARSTRLYNVAMSYNRGLDRDKDGIACEKA